MTPSENVLVDIGLPTLGTSPFLREAIESILAQTFTGWRLTISENGPGTEELRSMLAGYLEDGRIRHSVVGNLVSISANWTRAFEGESKYVTMLHDDDRWDEEFLARRVEFLEANPSCGFVFGPVKVIDEFGRLIHTTEHDIPSGPLRRDTILPIVYENCIIQPPTALIRRAAYDAVGPAFKEVFTNDHEMWIRLSAHADVGYLPVADSEYRYHNMQTTTMSRIRFGAGQLELIEATESVPIPSSVRRRARAKAHLLTAYGCVELGERRAALGHLAAGVRSQPSVLWQPGTVARILVALAALASGDAGRRRFTKWRVDRFLHRTGR